MRRSARRSRARSTSASTSSPTASSRAPAFTHSFYDAIEGIEPSPVPVRFRNAAGEKVLYNGVPRICGRLRKVDSPLVRDTDRLRSITDRPFKVTLPAASWFLPAAFYEKGITDRFYDSHEELLEDTLAIQRELIAEAIGAGARYVQLDFPNYVQLIDEGAREHAIVRQGIDPDAFFDKALELDRRVIEGFPTDVTFGLHICRGNFRSMWIYQGSLEPVAERVFNELPYDVFLVEWDEPERAGDYSALRHLPRGQDRRAGGRVEQAPAGRDARAARARDRAGRAPRRRRPAGDQPAVRVRVGVGGQRALARRPVAQARGGGAHRGRGVGPS